MGSVEGSDGSSERHRQEGRGRKANFGAMPPRIA